MQLILEIKNPSEWELLLSFLTQKGIDFRLSGKQDGANDKAGAAPEKRKIAAKKQSSGKQLAPQTSLQKLLLRGPVWSEEQAQAVLKTQEQLNQLGQNAFT
ncbi:MAG: hypothetical protein ACK4Q5_01035 [Saprospiraceae bacterium]